MIAHDLADSQADPGLETGALPALGAEPASPAIPGPGTPGPGTPAGSSTAFLRYTLPSLAVAGGLGLLELARQRFQQSHMFEPEIYPAGNWSPIEQGLDVRDVWFASEDRTRLHGWWMPHPGDRAGLGRARHGEPMTVVYCHGNSGNMATRVEIFRDLHRLGVDIFAFDYRGYGRSAGTPSEAGVCADVRAALDHVVGELGVPWHRIILFGHSLGGAVAIDGAWHRREIAGLVVQSSFTQVVDMARHFYPDLPIHWIARNGFRSIDKVRQLEMPKLFAHGKRDPTIPFVHGERLFEAATGPKVWLPVTRATHNDVHLWGGLRYFRALTRFRRQARKYGLARLEQAAASEVIANLPPCVDAVAPESSALGGEPSTESQSRAS